MTAKKINILLIEDNPGDVRLIREMLGRSELAYSLEHAGTLTDGLARLKGHIYDVILLDMSLPDGSGLDSVPEIKKVAPKMPIVMLTGLDDEETAVSALQLGVQDYLLKDRIDRTLLLRSLRYAVERKRILDALAESEGKYKNLVDNSLAGVFKTNLEGEILFANNALARMLEYESPGDLISLGALSIYKTPKDRKNLIDSLKKRGKVSNFEMEAVTKNGKTRNLLLSVTIYGEVLSGTMIDITERKRMEETIKHQAYHDLLTGLPNRLLFIDHLRLALARAHRDRYIVAVMYLDLDNFKEINDSLGHSAGDQLLQAVSRRLKACLRESDTIARIGGDEYNILLPKADHEEDIVTITDKIIAAFRQPFILDSHPVHTSTSIGVSLFPSDGDDAETLLKSADAAMYSAKNGGRNNYRFYNSAMNSRVLERMRLMNRLRGALKSGELAVYYQPQVSLDTGQVLCAEALVRWRHPEMGLLQPAQFIPFAEETGLITEVDEWVMRAACAQAGAWQKAGYAPVCVMVNYSSRHFQKSDFAGTVSGILQETGLDPVYLGIEISERTMMQDAELAVPGLMKLAGDGVRLCIDDFGTGCSSLHYLKKLPVQVLKIDRSFISGFSEDPDYKTITNAVINLARGLRLKVVAEGVENENQLAFLQTIRCDEAQGYHFSRPVPAEEFTRFLKPAG
ncbi:MAG: EAL domain-containing protein [Nitrospiraceae bacterium]|nr:MAG: EAL domain-containing protein [Nitrospiraceae bacterium]